MKNWLKMAVLAMAVGIMGFASTSLGAIQDSKVDYWYESLFEGQYPGPFEIIKDYPGYGTPYWVEDSDFQLIYVPNIYRPNLVKDFWLEVTWADGQAPETMNIDVALVVDSGFVVLKFDPAPGDDDWTWHWQIIPQPPFEYVNLDGMFIAHPDIVKVEVACRCIPEPTTIAIWALLSITCGGFGLRFWQQRRRPGLYPSRRAPWSNEARMAIHQIIEQGRMR